MAKLTLDANTASRLHELAQVVELCDPTGRVLGRFLPNVNLAEWELAGREASDEELSRREQSDQWYTTAEVLSHLKSLETK